MSLHQRPVHTCKARHLLLRDIRPTPNSQSQYLLRKADICASRCIYCDIWKLALLVYSRQNQTPNSPISPSAQQEQFYPRSSFPSNDYEKALKSLESAHHLQRTRLSSIVSICTFEGAEESEGLRVAHDRCLGAVLDLLRQERALQRQMLQREREFREREFREREREIRAWRERDYEYGYGSETRRAHAIHGESRRGSAISYAI